MKYPKKGGKKSMRKEEMRIVKRLKRKYVKLCKIIFFYQLE